jgi:hypothetical protein
LWSPTCNACAGSTPSSLHAIRNISGLGFSMPTYTDRHGIHTTQRYRSKTTTTSRISYAFCCFRFPCFLFLPRPTRWWHRTNHNNEAPSWAASALCRNLKQPLAWCLLRAALWMPSPHQGLRGAMPMICPS